MENTIRVSKCCSAEIYGVMIGEDDSIDCCSLCEHCCEGNTKEITYEEYEKL